MDTRARYIEVCSGVQNRLSDWLERNGMLDTMCRRAIELDARERRRDAWEYAWANYTKLFPTRTPPPGAAGVGK